MEFRLRPATSAPPDLWRMLGRSGQAFALGVLAWGIAYALAAPDWLARDLLYLTLIAAAIVVWKLFRYGVRKVIWRLRNRLMVSYVFMAVIPVALVVVMGALVAYLFSAQVLAYLVTTNLSHRVEELQSAVDAVMQAPPAARRDAITRMGAYYSGAYEGFSLHYRAGTADLRFPASTRIDAPPDAWPAARGLVARDGGFYLWARGVRDGASLTASVPMTNEMLNTLASGLGIVELRNDLSLSAAGAKVPGARGRIRNLPRSGTVPAARGALDREVDTLATTSYANWSEPGSRHEIVLAAHSRLSSVMNAIFTPDLAATNFIAGVVLPGFGVLFLIVELMALAVGVSLTRSITAAMHDLYQGTEWVMDGDLSHRIRVRGRDQIASLSHSFNRMTENVEQLLKVAAEKERLQADVEIAREVQAQMYPKSVPTSEHLQLAAACLPARTVSGDFYHYQRLPEGRIAFLLGDVAGKGISAALLMATIQTTCRARLDRPVECPSHMVSEINRQVCQHSAPEKYATLCFAIYDEQTHRLHYTNAAHLPPILIREGQVQRFNVDGTIVGSFPQVTFEASVIALLPGDLLVFFTDGVTEPENEYGEQFGDGRLIDLVQRHAERTSAEIIQAVSHAVRQWTGSPELQDDLTLLIARRT